MKQGFARRLFLAAALLLAALPALPQGAPLYTVEIVVFRNEGSSGALAGAQTVSPGSSDDVLATPVATRRLGGAAQKLRTAGGMRVLAHTAWTQSPTNWNSRRGPSAAELGLGAGVTGKVIFERGRFLHLGVDLTIEDGGQRYRINEVRQVKADELHYFDHPSVGVIAIVTAVGTAGG